MSIIPTKTANNQPPQPNKSINHPTKAINPSNSKSTQPTKQPTRNKPTNKSMDQLTKSINRSSPLEIEQSLDQINFVIHESNKPSVSTCTAKAQATHSQRTANEEPTHKQCTAGAQPAHSQCTTNAQPTHSQWTANAQPTHSQRTANWSLRICDTSDVKESTLPRKCMMHPLTKKPAMKLDSLVLPW